jgi:hypothetical protein
MKMTFEKALELIEKYFPGYPAILIAGLASEIVRESSTLPKEWN